MRNKKKIWIVSDFFSWTSEICLRTFWQYIVEHHLLWRDCKNFGFFSSFCPQTQNPIVPAHSKNIVLYCFCNSQVENNRIGTHNAPRQVSAFFLWFSLVCNKTPLAQQTVDACCQSSRLLACWENLICHFYC